MSDGMIMAQVMPQMIMDKLAEYSDEEIEAALIDAERASRAGRSTPRDATLAVIQAYFLGCEQRRRIIATEVKDDTD